MMELALSTRLAFTVRGGWTGALMDDRPDWVGSGSVTAGMAIY
jgi:hypothetical protein